MATEIRELTEKIIALDRVTRVVKGGRRFRFRATVVVGDGVGQVGVGVGKGRDAPSSIAKAVNIAKKSLISITIDGGTIAHDIQISFGGATVLLKPASPGTGVIAGGSARAVIEAAGIKDILAKCLGSNNKINNAYATIEALNSLMPNEAKKSEADTAQSLTEKPAAKPPKSKAKSVGPV